MTMLEDIRAKRQAATEFEMGALAYERFRLCREIAQREDRIAEIDALIATSEGKLTESERLRSDIQTATVVDEAMAAEPVKDPGGGQDG